jgi:hypothetical protein
MKGRDVNWNALFSSPGSEARQNVPSAPTASPETADRSLPFVLVRHSSVPSDSDLAAKLEIKHDPCWRVVARVFLPTRPAVNTPVHEPDRQIR